jgi:ABC-type nitrate/sulfonate/bicarbonate transport system permease component
VKQSVRLSLLSVLSFCCFIAVWKFTSTFLVSARMVPPPDLVLRTAIPMFISGEIVRHASISLYRLAVGFSAGTVLAIILGVPMGRLPVVRRLCEPIVQFFRFISPTAMIPIAVVWFGIGELSKYFLIFWGCFFVILLNTVQGVISTPEARLRAAACLGATRMQTFTRVVLPSAAPYIITGMRVALALSFTAIIPAEILAADSGLGYLLQQSSLLLQTNRIFVVLALFGVIGGLSDWLFRIATDRLFEKYL